MSSVGPWTGGRCVWTSAQEAYIHPVRTLSNDLFINYIGDTDASQLEGLPEPVAGRVAQPFLGTLADLQLATVETSLHASATRQHACQEASTSPTNAERTEEKSTRRHAEFVPHGS